MKKFIPDSRNFGGRKVIHDQFKYHYEGLANARAVLQTRSREMHSASNCNSSFSKNSVRKSS